MFFNYKYKELKNLNTPWESILGLNFTSSKQEDNFKMLYEYPAFIQNLQMLKLIVRGKDMLNLVVGDQGVGKTTLLNRFLLHSGYNWHICSIRNKSESIKVNARNLERLNQCPVYAVKAARTSVIMIDDAHLLNAEELSILIKYALPTEPDDKHKCLILFCRPEIKSTMAEIDNNIPSKHIINRLFMRSLSESQTSDYLNHRFKSAGIVEKNPFTRSQIKDIYKSTDGLPGWINNEACTLLKTLYSKH